ncbi:hypothetical protein BGW38_006599 [Lunasporangiospora selenospora]|uniref:GH16 domain-containing protein n=1 Tax=Lunasporangiospora selenospora TaxID=979761 RepID=A0A9P6FYZ0_9FUNG|nr:hypothetical protein BGW38_006599 [Lunasporangiospora selenospora]
MSGSTGPGIVTAVLLSNPAMGEEISFELTGKDPKKVITNYYLRVPIPDHDHDHTSERSHQNKHLHLEPSQQHHRHHNFHRHAHTKLLSHEEIHDLKHDSTQHELIYKIEWTDQMIRWSVDGKILRTVYAKDTPRSILSTGSSGLPTNAMQLQLTIWDAGYLPDVSEWAGGKTDYGEADTNEYVATVDSVEINCRDSKEGRKSWPGPDAMRRLKIAATRDKKLEKLARMSSVGDHGVVTSVKEFFEVALLSLIKWTFVLLSIVCGAAYLTEPKVNSLRPVRTSGLTTVQMSS